MAARMDKEEDGSSFVRLQIAITDPVAIQKVLDKRYLTGSVGGRAGKAVCSISGDDLAKMDESGKPRPSRFKRGQVYKGKLAYVDMQEIAFKEYSFVNQPADSKSSIRQISSPDKGDIATSDSQWVARSSAFVLHMDKEDIVSVEENQSVLSSMKKKESKPMYLHLKGAFLTAMALQESENYKYEDNSLLSDEIKDKDSCQENSNMDNKVQDDDILAAVEDLSEDLSAIAASVNEPESEPEEEKEDSETEESTKDAPGEEISEADGNSTIAALEKVLADSVVLSFVAQRAHWNVVDENFAEYHALFAAIYEDVDGAIDPAAENIRKLGGFPQSLTSMVMNASFKDDTTATDGSSLINDLIVKLQAANESVLSCFAAANEANEQGIANFMAERDDMHKKWIWQLKSTVGAEAGEPADESWRNIGSSVNAETKEELSVEVDSEVTEKTVEGQEVEDSSTELTSNESASEPQVDESKVQLLEEENKKLKNALHRTLVERVVDAKIAAGVESLEARESSIEEHLTRSAASLADSLRDLAKMPAAKLLKASAPEIDSDITVVEGEEDNVLTLDKQEEEVQEEEKEDKRTPEQIFVDALMGRRKL